MSYDPECYNLAATFLDDSKNAHCVQEKHYERLARIIQEVIEDYCNDGDNFHIPDTRDKHDTRDEHRGLK